METRYSKGRNYRFGKSLRKKGYRKNYNQLSYKKSRIGRYTKTDMQSIKCTYRNIIGIPSGNVYYVEQLIGGNDYINLADMLANSPEFVSRSTQYSYFKLSGMSVMFTRRWIDPIALGVNGVSPGFITLNNGLDCIDLNFYPNLKTSSVGVPVYSADSAFKFSPYIEGPQTHYQPFPRNFTTGSNSYGLGVWNPCNGYTNISGELALYNPGTGSLTSTFADVKIWDVEINLYIQFCNNTGA